MKDIFYKSKELFAVGNFKKAEKILLKIKKRTDEENNLLLRIYIALKKYKSAVALYEINERNYYNVNDLDILLSIGLAYNILNKKDKAILVLERSLKLDSSIKNAGALFQLVLFYVEQYNLVKVEELASVLLKWEDFYFKALLILIDNASKLRDLTLLKKRCRDLLPYYKAFLDNQILFIFENLLKCGLLDECDTLIKRVGSQFPNHLPLLQVSLDFERKNYKQVVDKLSNEVLKIDPSLHYMKAKSLEQLGFFDKAFNHFEQGALFRKSQIDNKSKNDDFSDFSKLIENTNFFENDRSCDDPFTKQPICFIFGFPRSGTTLLDNILDTQSNLIVMSELPVLDFVKQAVVHELGYQYPGDLYKLSEENLSYLREVYFTKVRVMGVLLDEGNILIDKYPQHTIDLIFIHLLFPYAKLILSLRHPVDVCLSCFQQDFSPHPDNLQLITLDNIVTRYNQVYSLLGEYEKKLQLQILSVRYEDLVHNFEFEMNKIFSFLDYKPVEDYADFYKHATRKYVSSLSRGQTSKPLYNSSISKWHQYQRFVEPYLPKLNYFINKFGYGEEV